MKYINREGQHKGKRLGKVTRAGSYKEGTTLEKRGISRQPGRDTRGSFRTHHNLSDHYSGEEDGQISSGERGRTLNVPNES